MIERLKIKIALILELIKFWEDKAKNNTLKKRVAIETKNKSAIKSADIEYDEILKNLVDLDIKKANIEKKINKK